MPGKPDLLLGYVFHEHNVLYGPKVHSARNELPRGPGMFAGPCRRKKKPGYSAGLLLVSGSDRPL
jgi:hypothetical protein